MKSINIYLFIIIVLFCTSYNLNAQSKVPMAKFYSLDTAICNNSIAHFQNKSINATHYKWYFGDGSTDTAVNPNHVYKSIGFYTVTLVARDLLFLDSLVVNNFIKVYPTPNVSIIAHDTNVCLNSFDTLTGNGAVTYKWYPIATSGLKIIVSPTHLTTYKLLGTSIYGCTDSASITLHVHNNPLVLLSPPYSNICPKDSATLKASGGIQYKWIPDLGATGDSMRVSPNKLTSYKVIGKDIYGCVDSAIAQMGNFSQPMVNIIPQSIQICQGNYDTLRATGAIKYTWRPGNDTGNVLPIIPLTTTTYFVYGTDMNGCTSNDSVKIIVNKYPVAKAGRDTAICFGSYVKIGEPNVKGNSYNWNPPGNLMHDTFSSTLANPPVTTTYTLTVTSRISGCVSIDSVSITIDSIPTAPFWDTAICPGHSIVLGVPSKKGYTYNWSPSTGLSATNIGNPILNTSNSAAYTLVMRDTTTGCFLKDSTIVAIFSVDSLPDIIGKKYIHKGDTTGYSFYGTPGFLYQWDISGAKIISGQGSDTITVVWLSSAIDSMRVYATNVCSDTIKFYVNKSTQTINIKNDINIKVIPNPANDYIYIKIIGNSTENIKGNILDVSGRVVKTFNVNMDVIEKGLSVSDLSKGVYILYLNFQSVKVRTKFIKAG